MTQNEERGLLLKAARNLVAALERDDLAAAESALDEVGIVGGGVYRAIGETARAVHEQLVSCLNDPGMSQLAHTDAPDARARLAHAIELTENAAHTTLSSVEDARPRARAIVDRCNSAESDKVRLKRIAEEARAIDSALGEILLAQSYQDLSGQLIRRAIALVEAVESCLVELLCHIGVCGDTGDGPAPGTEKGHGPAVPGKAGAQQVSGQKQVDDLLAELGF